MTELAANFNVSLIGLRGAGKTKTGERLATLLGKRFVDADARLVNTTGLQIPQIMERYRMPSFRAYETAVLEGILTERNLVIATGGGAVLSGHNRMLLRQNSVPCWLRAPIDTLAERIGVDPNRPMLTAAATRHEELTEQSKERSEFYASIARITIDTADYSVDEVAQQIVEQLDQLPQGV